MAAERLARGVGGARRGAGAAADGGRGGAAAAAGAGHVARGGRPRRAPPPLRRRASAARHQPVAAGLPVSMPAATPLSPTSPILHHPVLPPQARGLPARGGGPPALVQVAGAGPVAAGARGRGPVGGRPGPALARRPRPALAAAALLVLRLHGVSQTECNTVSAELDACNKLRYHP